MWKFASTVQFSETKESFKVPDSLTNCGRGPQSRVSVRWFMRVGQALVFWRLIYIHHATHRQGGEYIIVPSISGEDGTKCSGTICRKLVRNYANICLHGV